VEGAPQKGFAVEGMPGGSVAGVSAQRPRRKPKSDGTRFICQETKRERRSTKGGAHSSKKNVAEAKRRGSRHLSWRDRPTPERAKKDRGEEGLKFSLTRNGIKEGWKRGVVEGSIWVSVSQKKKGEGGGSYVTPGEKKGLAQGVKGES